jgi:glycolate oxidase
MTETGEKPNGYNELTDEIYKLAIKLGGTITAEHGVGKIRNKRLHIQYSDKQLEIMRGIKNVFDPNNILNPGTGIG